MNAKETISIVGDGERDQQDGSRHHVVATVDADERICFRVEQE
jgi:hypothetical protein